MDKLKKSAVAKVVAAILLSVSLFMAAVSSCVVVAAISYGGSSQMQAEAIYDGYMGNLVDNSSYQVDEYYKAYPCSGFFPFHQDLFCFLIQRNPSLYTGSSNHSN